MPPILGPTEVRLPGWFNFGELVGPPVSGQVTSPFGPRPPILTPIGWTSTFHNGVDIMADVGTPIICPVDEMRITAEGPAINGYGNVVFGVTPDGYTLLFAHMQPGLHAGLDQVLHRGDVVGQVGTTGASTGPHLHFAIGALGFYVTNVNLWIDPLLWTDPMPMFSKDIAPVDYVKGTWPPDGMGAYVVVVTPATVKNIIDEAYREGVSIASISMLIEGVWYSYLVGAPMQVNERFPGIIPATTAIYVLSR